MRFFTQSGLFENEIGPEMLHSGHETRALEEYQRNKPSTTDYMSILSYCVKFSWLYVCWMLDSSTPSPTSFLKYVISLFSEYSTCSI